MSKKGKGVEASPGRRKVSKPSATRMESPDQSLTEEEIKQKLLDELMSQFQGQSMVSLEALKGALKSSKKGTEKSETKGGTSSSSCGSDNFAASKQDNQNDGEDKDRPLPAATSRNSCVSASESEDQERTSKVGGGEDAVSVKSAKPLKRDAKALENEDEEHTKSGSEDKRVKAGKPSKTRKGSVKSSASEDEGNPSKKGEEEGKLVPGKKSSRYRKGSVKGSASEDDGHHSKKGEEEDQGVRSSKSGQGSIKGSASEDDGHHSKKGEEEDQGVRPSKSRQGSVKGPASEDDDVHANKRGPEEGKAPSKPFKLRKISKPTSGSDDDNSNKRILKDDFDFLNVPKTSCAPPSVYKKLPSSKASGLKQRVISSDSKTLSDCNPESKRGKRSSSVSIVGKMSLQKPVKNHSTDEKHDKSMISSKITSATMPLPMTPKTDIPVKGTIESPKQKPKFPLAENSAIKPLSKPHETSADVQTKVLMSEELLGSSKLKSKKLEDLEQVLDQPTQSLAFKQAIAADDPQARKSLGGKVGKSPLKNSKKFARTDNVKIHTASHDLTRVESVKDRDKDLKHDEITDSTTLAASRSQHQLDKTQREHDMIATIEERGKVKAPSMKRKLSTLEHNPHKNKVVRSAINDETSLTSESIDRSVSNMECVVRLPRLSQECLAKFTPPKSYAVEDLLEGTEVTGALESSHISGSSKISKEDVFLKPAIPKNTFLKKKTPFNSPTPDTSLNSAKKPQKFSKPMESRVQKKPSKFSANDSLLSLSDQFAGWHKPKMNLNPLDKLDMPEELDYEPGGGDDDDVLSVFADSTILENVGVAHVPEDMLVQRQARDSDMDSLASFGSDDSRRLSDMDSDDNDNSDVPPDAQDELDDSRKLELDISAPASLKENVLGVPVEVYSACNIITDRRDSVESGELVDDDDEEDSDSQSIPDSSDNTENVIIEKKDSSNLLETKTETPQRSKKFDETDLVILPKKKSTKECIENLLSSKNNCKEHDNEMKSSTDEKERTDHEMSKFANTCDSSVQGGDPTLTGAKCRTLQGKTSIGISSSEASNTCPSIPVKNKRAINTKNTASNFIESNAEFSNALLRDGCESNLSAVAAQNSFEMPIIMAPSTPPKKPTSIASMQVDKNQCGMDFDSHLSERPFPNVHFESPKRGPLLPTPPAPLAPSTSKGLLKTPECPRYSVDPSISSRMSLAQAPILTAIESPTAERNETPEGRDIPKFLETTWKEPITASLRSTPVPSTCNKSPLGIQPIHQSSHHYGMSLKDVDLRLQDVDHRAELRQQDVGHWSSFNHRDADLRYLRNPEAADDPVEKALMLYCAKYLTDGACSNANCSKLHEFPELGLNEDKDKLLSISLIDKMLVFFPFWREKCFYSSIVTLGSYDDKGSLTKIAEYFWNHCCNCLSNKTKVDYICWKQLAQAFAMCGLAPSWCTRSLLKVLKRVKKHENFGQFYDVIDNIVDELFPDFIKGQSDLWSGLSVLASLKNYEIPANVMREILRDTLSEPHNIQEHSQICDYLLKQSPRSMQPRKPEERELFHLIHQFLFVLHQGAPNESRAEQLAKHFKIPLINNCCFDYCFARIQATAVKGVQDKIRFSLSRPFSPFMNGGSDVFLNNNKPYSQQSGADELAKSTSLPASHVPSDAFQNEPISRSLQDTFAIQNSSATLQNRPKDNQGTSRNELVNARLLPTNDTEGMNLGAPSDNTTETNTSHPPSSQRTYPKMTIVARGDRRHVKEKPSIPTPPLPNSHFPRNERETRIIKTSPPSVKTPQSTKEETETSGPSVTVMDLIKQKQCGKAAKFIAVWKGNAKAREKGIPAVIDALLSMDSRPRIEAFCSLLLAIGAQMTGTADNQLKAIMIRIGLGLLENFLRNEHYLEAKEVHDKLWGKMCPSKVKMESHSPSYLELITAWVYVKNEKIKEALEIVNSNVFYDVLEKWSIPGNPNDIELRDEVCSIIFNHCKGIEAYVLHTEKLFRGMLLAQSSYKIDVAQFYDDILRALVRAHQEKAVKSLLVWAHNQCGLKPLRGTTNRLLVIFAGSLPNNSAWSPEIVSIFQDEPYKQAVPTSVEGLSRIKVYLQSVWNTDEVSNILKFLLNCHICNLEQDTDFPQIALEIKECALPTPEPGEYLFPESLLSIDPSVPAMQERVLTALPQVLGQNNSRFNDGVLEINQHDVHKYITQRRRAIDSKRPLIQHTSRGSMEDSLTNSSRNSGNMAPEQNQFNVSNYEPWQPYPQSMPFQNADIPQSSFSQVYNNDYYNFQDQRFSDINQSFSGGMSNYHNNAYNDFHPNQYPYQSDQYPRSYHPYQGNRRFSRNSARYNTRSYNK